MVLLLVVVVVVEVEVVAVVDGGRGDFLEMGLLDSVLFLLSFLRVSASN